MFRTPKGKKQTPKKSTLRKILTDELDLDEENGFILTTKERRRLQRSVNSPYLNTERLDRISESLPDGTRLTRGKVHTVGGNKPSPELPRPYITPIKNRFAAFEINFTPTDANKTVEKHIFHLHK